MIQASATRIEIQYPFDYKNLRKKVRAWEELFTDSPRMYLTGTMAEVGTRELCFLRGNEVEEIRPTHMLVRVDGDQVAIGYEKPALSRHDEVYLVIEEGG